jgi:hypothetical protein
MVLASQLGLVPDGEWWLSHVKKSAQHRLAILFVLSRFALIGSLGVAT